MTNLNSNLREFRSELENLMEAEELDYPAVPVFGPYRPYLKHAIAHPAKANIYLIEFLVRNYTSPGDLILDPTAGTGSTCVVSALHGRDAICIDIEPKFYEWMEKAREKVEKAKTLAPKGRMITILGDARKLTELLKSKTDIIITSPPYGIFSHGEYPTKRLAEVGIKYPSNPGNIDNRPYEGEGETYITAMIRVYSGMFKVLKPGGLAIVIVKPFIRNKKVVDLPYITWRLLDNVGFKLIKLYKLRLHIMNFWRVLYYKKFPDVPLIAHEYVIVCAKNDGVEARSISPNTVQNK